LARCAIRILLEELSPKGHLLGPEITAALTEKCEFISYPKGDDYIKAVENGLQYELGHWNDIKILRFGIYPGVIAVDTGSSTDDSQKVLTEILEWSKETLGVAYQPSMMKNPGYLSQITFRTDVPLIRLNPKLEQIAARISESVSRRSDFEFSYSFAGLVLNYDTTNIKQSAAPFTLERRVDTPYSENVYYSQAALSTSEHLSILEECEAALTP